MLIRCLQHVPFEGPGMIETWAQARGHSFAVTRMDLGEIPSQDFDGLVLMGGPMSVNDEEKYPWLAFEKQVIERAIGQNKPILGICLGAQLIASALGSRVYQNREREIGWWPVHIIPETPFAQLFPATFTPFHWHGETFDLPKGAIHLVKSEGCEHQAFSYGEHTLGLQFHLEITAAGIQSLVTHCPEDLAPGRFVTRGPHLLLNQPHIDSTHMILKNILGSLFSTANHPTTTHTPAIKLRGEVPRGSRGEGSSPTAPVPNVLARPD